MLALENIAKSYGPRLVLPPTSLSFPPGQTTALLGQSGCGKSTLLKILAGLVVPDQGTVVRRGEFGYVLQEGGLFPHLTALENVTLLARYQKKLNYQSALDHLTALVQLNPADLQRYPKDLSGGQRQRVALMRALLLDPPILLLDEPMGALDPITRSQLQRDLKVIFQTLAKTVVLVTHDLGEAAYLAQEIVLLRDGVVIQRGSFAALRDAPAHPYVSEFIQAQRSPV